MAPPVITNGQRERSNGYRRSVMQEKIYPMSQSSFSQSFPRPRVTSTVSRQKRGDGNLLGSRHGVYFAFWILVIVICPLIRSASNFTLSPAFTAFRKARSWTG